MVAAKKTIKPATNGNDTTQGMKIITQEQAVLQVLAQIQVQQSAMESKLDALLAATAPGKE